MHSPKGGRYRPPLHQKGGGFHTQCDGLLLTFPFTTLWCEISFGYVLCNSDVGCEGVRCLRQNRSVQVSWNTRRRQAFLNGVVAITPATPNLTLLPKSIGPGEDYKSLL